MAIYCLDRAKNMVEVCTIYSQDMAVQGQDMQYDVILLGYIILIPGYDIILS